MPVKYTNVNEQKLFKFSTRVLEKVGIPTEDAAIAARLMVNTDLRGIASHGVAHLGPLYVKGIKEGTINFKPNIKIWSGAPGDCGNRWRSRTGIRGCLSGNAGSHDTG